jgi:tetratricopeptide (TPR) repeat protein
MRTWIATLSIERGYMANEEDGPSRPTVAEPLARRGGRGEPTVTLDGRTEPRRLPAGTQLGRFKIVELLGEGGMGAVYRASDAELGRQVAIKVLTGVGESEAGGAVEQRLMREAQALAKLNHPNVIAIYDVAREHGVAFVAMELVEGVGLGAWLEQGHRRDEILAVFAQAGHGLAAAHKEGLVHRDFKPANVIVGADGRVRVLDFGLARASGSPSPTANLSTEDDDVLIGDSPTSRPTTNLLTSPLTQVGRLVGTPTYMAPEQLRGGEIDARSDQFSFCVALYRALYGELPFDGRAVAERLANIDAGNVRPAPADSDVPPWLRRLLVRGLAAAPEARFSSMEALLAALADDPAPRRRRRLVAALGVASVAAGSAVVMQLAREPAPEPCAGAAQALDEVWSMGRRAEIAKTFVASDRPFAKKMLATVTEALDRYGADWSAMRGEACRATRVTGQQSGELLDLRMQCLDRHLVHLRAATDVLVTADASVIEKALQVVQALPPLAACADATALRAPMPLPSDPVTRGRIDALRADLARSDALFAAGKLAAATELVERVHVQAPALGYLPLTAEAAKARGNAQFENGDYDAAEQTMMNGAALALSARRDDLVADMWRELILIVGYEKRQFAAAHAWAELAEAMLARLERDPNRQAMLYGALGALSMTEERRDEALRYDLLALDLLTKTFGETSNRVAVGLNNVGTDYLYSRNFAKAREYFRRVLEIREKLVGPDHPATGRAVLNLASATAELGEIEESIALDRRALAILEPVVGSQHPMIATALGNLGNSLMMIGRFDEAQAAFERALAIATVVYGPKAPQIAVLHARRGALHRRQGRPRDALAELQAALAIDRARDPESAATGRDVYDIADALVELGRYSEAKRELERAHAILNKALGPTDIEVAGPLAGLGHLALAQKRASDAVAPFESALALLGKDDRSVEAARTRFGLARALWDSTRDRDRARQLADEATKLLATSQDESRHALLEQVAAWVALINSDQR